MAVFRRRMETNAVEQATIFFNITTETQCSRWSTENLPCFLVYSKTYKLPKTLFQVSDQVFTYLFG